MKKKGQKEKSVSPELEARLKEHLQSKEPLFGKDSPFSELLQGMVNQMLEGEMEAFQADQKASEKRNKRNGHTTKRVLIRVGSFRYQNTKRSQW
jgi:putative transposase